MNLIYSEDTQMLSETMGRFISDRYDFVTRQRAANGDFGYDADVWTELAALGITGALFDEASGGYAGDGFSLMAVFEQIGRGLMVEPFLPALMAGRALQAVEGQSARVMAVANGARIAFAHQEPGARFGMTTINTTARRDGEEWVLDGAKTMVAQVETADMIVVSARTGGAVDSTTGISLFVVPRNVAGVYVRGNRSIDGGRTGELSLAEVRLSGDALMGTDGNAWDAISEAHAAGLLALCAEAIGVMDVLRETTLDYMRTRAQFGGPIGRFQVLQHRMATLSIDIEQARSSVINAAAAWNGAPSRIRDRTIAAAKFTVGRVGTLVAEEAIQIHGGIGMTWELPLSHYAKRAVMIDHMLGDEDHHLKRFIDLRAA